MQPKPKTPTTTLETLCAGVMPHIAARIKRAYWIGAAEGVALAVPDPKPDKKARAA